MTEGAADLSMTAPVPPQVAAVAIQRVPGTEALLESMVLQAAPTKALRTEAMQ